MHKKLKITKCTRTLSFLFPHALEHKYPNKSLSHKWQQQVRLLPLSAPNTAMNTHIPAAVMRCLVSRVCVQLVELSSGHAGFSRRLQTSINSLQRDSNTHKPTLSHCKNTHTCHTCPLQIHTHGDTHIICLPLSHYTAHRRGGREEGETRGEEAEVNSSLSPYPSGNVSILV